MKNEGKPLLETLINSLKILPGVGDKTDKGWHFIYWKNREGAKNYH
ncbi:MAG: hypothetical protein CM15mP12_8390 [Gammaproteobacteria bacterium]|nr:MAG: hypothetical protein CM15mP12_8390 [Gammaproteobacteria bacterium]